MYLFIVISSINLVHAQSCNEYTYQPLENIVEFDGEGQFKIISTAAASVDFDDPSEIMSARREAELLAKRAIAEYINQKLSSEDSISSEISKSKTNSKAVDGSVVSSAQRDEVKKQISSVVTRTDALLKGVITIGSCYTKGHEIRVTVGIKSQTFANASQLEKSMGAASANSYGARKEVDSKNPNNQTTTNLNKTNNNESEPSTKSYNGSKQLNKF
jgi:hypothetical protein